MCGKGINFLAIFRITEARIRSEQREYKGQFTYRRREKRKCFAISSCLLCTHLNWPKQMMPLLSTVIYIFASSEFFFFFSYRESSRNDDQVQTCVEDYLQVLTSILSEKRYLSVINDYIVY